MNLLFDEKWLDVSPDEVVEGHPDPTVKSVTDFLKPEDTANRIAAAIERSTVWAQVASLGNHKIPVHDVRVLHNGVYNHQNFFIETETRMQVLIAEGWRSPSRVWTEEQHLEVLEGVQ